MGITVFILSNFILIVSLVFIIFIIGQKRYLSKKFLSKVFFVFVCINLVFSSLSAWGQYRLWQSSSIMKYTLPPYNKISYFMNYSYHIFFKRLIWRLVGAFIIFLLMHLAQILFRRSLFWEEELLLLPFLTALIDFPLGLILLPAGLLALLLLSLKQGWRASMATKLTLRPYWAYLGAILIGLNFFLLKVDWFYKLQP